MALVFTLKRSTPNSLLYLASYDGNGGSPATLSVTTLLSDAIPDSPIAVALKAVRGDTGADAIADLFQGPPVGTVNAGGGVPGTGKQTPQAPEIRSRVRARASAGAPGTPTAVAWAITGAATGTVGELSVGTAATDAPADAYVEIRRIPAYAA